MSRARVTIFLFLLAMLMALLVGCADLDEVQGPHVRPCSECYYVNETASYQSLYLPDGRVIPVLPGSRVDIDELGIRNYTIHEAKR